jgi:hypothetical protein
MIPNAVGDEIHFFKVELNILYCHMPNNNNNDNNYNSSSSSNNNNNNKHLN